MTPPRYEIHASDCPRLCQSQIAVGNIEGCIVHESHACPPCTGARMVAVDKAQLEELVEAASVLADDDLFDYDVSGWGKSAELRRFVHALQPFRRGEKENT